MHRVKRVVAERVDVVPLEGAVDRNREGTVGDAIAIAVYSAAVDVLSDAEAGEVEAVGEVEGRLNAVNRRGGHAVGVDGKGEAGCDIRHRRGAVSDLTCGRGAVVCLDEGTHGVVWQTCKSRGHRRRGRRVERARIGSNGYRYRGAVDIPHTAELNLERAGTVQRLAESVDGLRDLY